MKQTSWNLIRRDRCIQNTKKADWLWDQIGEALNLSFHGIENEQAS